jgi:hypothetical protein
MSQELQHKPLPQGTQTLEKNKFILRLPCEYHAHLTEISRLNRRSMNSEITLLLEQHLTDLLTRGLQSTVESLGLHPVLPKPAHKVAEKFQVLSLEKKKALLALLG